MAPVFGLPSCALESSTITESASVVARWLAPHAGDYWFRFSSDENYGVVSQYADEACADMVGCTGFAPFEGDMNATGGFYIGWLTEGQVYQTRIQYADPFGAPPPERANVTLLVKDSPFL